MTGNEIISTVILAICRKADRRAHLRDLRQLDILRSSMADEWAYIHTCGGVHAVT